MTASITAPAPAPAPPVVAPPRRRRRAPDEDEPVGVRPSSSSRVLSYVGLAAFALYSVAPVWWLVVSATKDQTDLYSTSGLWFARLNIVANLRQIFTYNDGIFLRWTLNSLLYATVGAGVGMVVAVAAGYGLARFEFRGRKLALAIVIGSFLVPGTLLTLPLYLLFAKMGIVDTPWAVLIPAFINPFSVYLAKVYVEGAVPVELLEAARMDGAGELRIFVQIVLRLMTTGGATVFLLAFVGSWNGFFLPLTMLRGEDKWTLALGLFDWASKRTETGVDLTALVITGSLLSVVPLMVVMVAMQRYWRSGVTLGSLK